MQNSLTREQILGALARKFSPVGFATFFSLVNSLILPEHHVRAINEIFDSFEDEDSIGIIIEMFRGSAKTTVENNAFGAWLVGHFPEKSGLIVQANDDIGSDNSAKIANIIENTAGWQVAFPHIVPDTNAGWGAKGYYVKKTHTDASMQEEVSYSQWQQMRAGVKDPTFIGVGYNSSSIIGKRPYWLVIDDINDEKNTRSDRMLRQVKDVLKGTIFPAANMAKVIVVIGTPWNESDAIHYCLSTGLFKHAKIPVYTQGKPTWPEWFGEKKIEIEKAKSGDVEFARMYLLDLERTKGLVLKKEWLEPYFPNEEIKKDWPAIIFIDYTSTKNPLKEKSDYCALAVAQIVPGNRKLIISDGFYKRLTRYDAQKMAISKILEYPNLLQVGVEAIFSGDEYHSVLESNQELVDAGIIPEACRGGPWQKKKSHRFETVLADAVQRGIVIFSNAETEFFNAFKSEWLGWQGNELADMGHDDALDAVFGAVHLGLKHLIHGAAVKYETNNLFYPQKETNEYKWIEGMTNANR
jgi:hypothetical protein